MNDSSDLFEPASSEQSLLRQILRWTMRLFFHGLVRPPVPIWLQRGIIRLLTMITVTPRGVVRGLQTINGVPCEWQHGDSGRGKVMLYIHGGAFMIGSPALISCPAISVSVSAVRRKW